MARDQNAARNYRIPLNFQCPSCNAMPGDKCGTIGCLMRLSTHDINAHHFLRTASAVESAARHLATVEAISELMERDARGKSWHEASAAIDKAAPVIK